MKQYNDFYYLKSMGVETQIGFVQLIGKPIIKKYPNSIIKIMSGVTLDSDVQNNPAGICHPVILATMSENAQIVLGRDSGLSGATLCARTKIEIGEYVGIGANTSIFDNDFHPANPYLRKFDNDKNTLSAPILIEDFSWIGGNCIILKGTRIGKGAVVGAGSVVTSIVPELSIFAGNPAKFRKKIDIDHETYHNLFNSGKE
ncbi:MAG: acyltransferase [Paludibacteraceae bacterium]